MGIGYYNTLGSLQAAGPTLTTSTIATSLLNPQAKITLPAGFFAYVGQRLLIRGQGQLSNIVTTPGTFTLDIRFGAAVVFNGGAMNMSGTAKTTLPFWFDIELTVRVVGSSANLIGQGRATAQGLNTSAGGTDPATHTTLLMPNTTPAPGANFDSTAAQLVDCFGTFSVSNSGNNFTLQQFELISPNWGG